LERGQRVEITVINQLREATTVHWHGMELESYYDGVADWGAHGNQVTPMINPGAAFRVRFTPPRSGTFMYHTHLHDQAQLSGGLYGPLIVVERGAKFDPEHDSVVVLSRGGPGPTEGPVLFNGGFKPPTLHWQTGQRYRRSAWGGYRRNQGLLNVEQFHSFLSDLDLLYHLHLQSGIEDLQLQSPSFSRLILKIVRFAGQGGLKCVLHQGLFRGQVCAISCDRSPLKLLLRGSERDSNSIEGSDIDKS